MAAEGRRVIFLGNVQWSISHVLGVNPAPIHIPHETNWIQWVLTIKKKEKGRIRSLGKHVVGTGSRCDQDMFFYIYRIFKEWKILKHWNAENKHHKNETFTLKCDQMTEITLLY